MSELDELGLLAAATPDDLAALLPLPSCAQTAVTASTHALEHTALVEEWEAPLSTWELVLRECSEDGEPIPAAAPEASTTAQEEADVVLLLREAAGVPALDAAVAAARAAAAPVLQLLPVQSQSTLSQACGVATKPHAAHAAAAARSVIAPGEE